MTDNLPKRKRPALFLRLRCENRHQPSYPNEGRHHELPGPEPDESPDLETYLGVVRQHIEELCGGKYGDLFCFWWDMNVPQHRDPSINARIRELQPGILINNRGYDEGDFSTPERDRDDQFASGTDDALVEACHSVGSLSWGYKKDEDYFSIRHLQGSMARHFVNGANYLLNVGPDADSLIPEKAELRFSRIGDWLKRVGEALLGDVAPIPGFPAAPNVLVSRTGNTLYLILTKPHPTGGIRLRPIRSVPLDCVLLNTNTPLETRLDRVPCETHLGGPFLRIPEIPLRELGDEVPIIRLQFGEDPLPTQQTDSGQAEEI